MSVKAARKTNREATAEAKIKLPGQKLILEGGWEKGSFVFRLFVQKDGERDRSIISTVDLTKKMLSFPGRSSDIRSYYDADMGYGKNRLTLRYGEED